MDPAGQRILGDVGPDDNMTQVPLTNKVVVLPGWAEYLRRTRIKRKIASSWGDRHDAFVG